MEQQDGRDTEARPTRITTIYEALLGFDLPRKLWVRLKHLRTEVGRFKNSTFRWGRSDLPFCSYGPVPQTPQHINRDCPNYHSRNILGLTLSDEVAILWLQRLDEDLNC